MLRQASSQAKCCLRLSRLYQGNKLCRMAKFSTTSRLSTEDLNTHKPMNTTLKGRALLNAPAFNKGTAFTAQERKDFELDGLLPSQVQTLKEQVERAYGQYCSLSSDLLKNSFMTSMHDQNQVLFYKLFEEHIKEMMPIVYTPTTGEAISKYSKLFRRPEGCFLQIDNSSEEIDARLSAWGKDGDVDYIICSDSEAILGIGDQGVGGIGISVAKLVLMTLCGGIDPAKALPIVLDVGTNNQDLLGDDLYLGLRKNRITGKEYDDFLHRFVKAIENRFPSATLHFEDFGTANAQKLLDKYRDEFCCFNDDSQGTSAVVLAALTAGVWVTKSKLKEQKVVIYGAGTAGLGIANRIRDAMVTEGLSEAEAEARIFLLDRPGLLLESLKSGEYKMTKSQAVYAKKDEEFDAAKKDGKVDLLRTVEHVKPDVLIGCSGQHGAFTKEVIEEMAKHQKRPIVLPLSNPTRLIEGTPADINEWTKGKALIATGSPFKPVEYDGRQYIIGESNNALVFPGIGLGCVLSRAKTLSDSMIVAAAKALAAKSPALKDPDQALLPDIKDVRETSLDVATAVVLCAIEEGSAQNGSLPENKNEMRAWVEKHMWKPEYRDLHLISEEDSSARERGETGFGGVGSRT